MLSLEQLQSLAKLADNLEILLKKLEKAYNENNAEDFNKSKKEILDIKENISNITK